MTSYKTLIVYKSVHHQNTAKVAAAIADVLQADIHQPEEIVNSKIADYDLIGVGSGIYFGRFHRALRGWVNELPQGLQRRAFVFSTSGMPFLWQLWHAPLKRQLRHKGFQIAGEFHCSGFDTVGPLWLLGGLNRRHPDEHDLANATAFARRLLTDMPSDDGKDG